MNVATETLRIRHSVCRWCYPAFSLEELARAGRELGLESIELLDPEDWPTLKRLGLCCAVANGGTTIGEGLNRPENHARQISLMLQRIEDCAAAGVPSVICFSGNRSGLGDEEGLENCAAAVRQIVGLAERRGVTILMELLNSRVDHPDYMCDRSAWGVELCRRVGSERFKLLYDLYHMRVMGEDLLGDIERHHACIGHYHTGGVPGRHEIDESQELDYPSLMRAILATGYKGFVGQEFIPTRAPLASLRDAIRRCSV